MTTESAESTERSVPPIPPGYVLATTWAQAADWMAFTETTDSVEILTDGDWVPAYSPDLVGACRNLRHRDGVPGGDNDRWVRLVPFPASEWVICDAHKARGGVVERLSLDGWVTDNRRWPFYQVPHGPGQAGYDRRRLIPLPDQKAL